MTFSRAPQLAARRALRPARAPLSARGFTLLEIGIALVLLGLMLAITVPSLNALSGAELRKTTGMLQGLMRDTYARAALSGHSHRIVIDMEQGSYWVEMTEGGIVMPRKKLEPTREGLGFLDPVDERIEDIDAETADEQEQTKIQLYRPPQWTPVPFPGEDKLDEVKPAKLPSDVRVHRVWVDHLADPITGGQVAVHFYPGGYTQEAHLSLTDDDNGDRTLTLVTHPLTGEVFVEDEIPELPRNR
jgi:type II secretory pathway pseudopilin PulG